MDFGRDSAIARHDKAVRKTEFCVIWYLSFSTCRELKSEANSDEKVYKL
jgi:hypothetical protein